MSCQQLRLEGGWIVPWWQNICCAQSSIAWSCCRIDLHIWGIITHIVSHTLVHLQNVCGPPKFSKYFNQSPLSIIADNSLKLIVIVWPVLVSDVSILLWRWDHGEPRATFGGTAMVQHGAVNIWCLQLFLGHCYDSHWWYCLWYPRMVLREPFSR